MLEIYAFYANILVLVFLLLSTRFGKQVICKGDIRVRSFGNNIEKVKEVAKTLNKKPNKNLGNK